MTSEAESKMISRRGILPLLGLATALGLALRYTAAEAQTPAWSGVKTGAESASIGVTSGVEASLHQKNPRKASLHKPSLYRNSS